MKKLLFALLLSVSCSFALSDETQTVLQEIKTLREDMNKEMKNLREDMNKRLEQTDKRIEQIDKRIDFMQSLVYLLLSITIGAPFLAEYIRGRKDSEERKMADNIKSMLFVLREMAQEDEKLDKKLRAAGLV